MCRLLCFIAAFAIISAIQATPQSGLDRSLQLHGLAQGNYLIGDRSGAIRALEQGLRINPEYLPAFRLKARIHIDTGKLEDAQKTITEALKIDPNDVESRIIHALILGKLGNVDEAQSMLEAVIGETTATSRTGQIARQLSGILHSAEENWDRAAEAFESISAHKPENRRLAAEAYVTKAEQLGLEGKFQESIEAIDQAIALYKNPKNKEDLNQRRKLQYKRSTKLIQIGDQERAIRELESLRSDRASSIQISLTLAPLYLNTGRWEKVESLLPEIGASQKLNDIHLYLEGRVALARKRVGTARAKFEAALEIVKTEDNRLLPSLHFYRGLCMDLLGRRTEAETSVILAVDLGYEPDNRSEAEALARILLPTNRSGAAIPIIEKALIRGDQSAKLWAALGRAHRKAGDHAVAISAFNEAIKLAPESAYLRVLRGSLLRRIGDLRGAIADFDTARDLGNQDPVLNYESGLALLQMGRVEEAEAVLFNASKDLKDQSTLYLLHATTAYTIGRNERALESLKKYTSQWSAKSSDRQRSPQIVDTAIFLRELLNLDPMSPAPEIGQFAELFIGYQLGKATRKEVFDRAGRANSDSEARKQISTMAFWLAQHEKENGNYSEYSELIAIATEFGNQEIPEWQYAKWQQTKLSKF